MKLDDIVKGVFLLFIMFSLFYLVVKMIQNMM